MRTWFLGLMVMLAGAVAASAQSEAGQSPYFDCPYINYFDRGCPQLREAREAEARRRQQEAFERGEQPDLPAPLPGVEAPQQQEGVEGLDPDYLERLEQLLPLFPKESLAPDTPVLYRLLLARPTLENARHYVRWYARRAARLQEVQALVKRAGEEFQAEPVATGRRRR